MRKIYRCMLDVRGANDGAARRIYPRRVLAVTAMPKITTSSWLDRSSRTRVPHSERLPPEWQPARMRRARGRPPRRGVHPHRRQRFGLDFSSPEHGSIPSCKLTAEGEAGDSLVQGVRHGEAQERTPHDPQAAAVLESIVESMCAKCAEIAEAEPAEEEALESVEPALTKEQVDAIEQSFGSVESCRARRAALAVLTKSGSWMIDTVTVDRAAAVSLAAVALAGLGYAETLRDLAELVERACSRVDLALYHRDNLHGDLYEVMADA